MIAFRYQKLAIGMEALEEFHKKMPDQEERERRENVPPTFRDSLLPKQVEAARQKIPRQLKFVKEIAGSRK